MKKILVIGDSCWDEHIYCSADRLCPDKPVPVLVPVIKTVNPGMAANVHRNIYSQYPFCELFTNKNAEDIKKTRYVHQSTNHLFFRVDSGGRSLGIDTKDIEYDYDLIVVSDYDKGFLSECDIQTIIQNHPKVILDTKKILGDWAVGAHLIKINNHEYDRSKHFIFSNPHLSNKIIKTCGSKGCEFLEKTYPVDEHDVIDVSGAGDSFLAGFCIKYVQNSNIEEAIIYANKCASEVVQKRGVTSI